MKYWQKGKHGMCEAILLDSIDRFINSGLFCTDSEPKCCEKVAKIINDQFIIEQPYYEEDITFQKQAVVFLKAKQNRINKELSDKD